MGDPGLSVRPGLLGSARPQSFGPSLADVLRAAPPTNRRLETPRVITPTVAPERFYDHEVIMKALRCMCVELGFIVVADSSFVLIPCG
jgi:hypothetical protein